MKRDTAKTLGLAERELVRRLVNEGFLFRTPSGGLRAYSTHERRGFFRHRAWVSSAQPEDGSPPRSGSQVLVTPAGVDFFARRWPREPTEALP